MTQFASTSSGDDEILAQIMLERDQAGSRALDPEVYVKRYPHLEGEIRELFQVQKALDTSRPDADIPQPERLGEFRILRKVAQGGMGEIYEAVQEPLQRRVAVKVIRHGRISPSARERFLREQKVLAQLHQTHIVPIHTAGEEGPLQYFAMPFIDGAALSHVVRAAFQFETSQPGSKTPPLGKLAAMLVAESKERAKTTTSAAISNKRAVEAQKAKRATKALPSSEPSAGKTPRLVLSLEYFRSVAQVMADAAEALHYAHRANVLHRDVKPSNIMVDKDEQCWLIDFGLAGYLKEENRSGAEVEGDQVRQEPTTISGAMGTYQYMAPEQFGGKADARADVWGLGATLYELLTLRRAFDGDSDKEIRDKVLSAEPSRLKELVANLPADPAAICRKAIQKQPGLRYQTTLEFAEDLRRWLRTEPTHARPARALRRTWLWSRRNKGWAAALLAAVLALVAVGAAVVHDERIRVENLEAERTAADGRARDREREMLIMQLQQLRIGQHSARWFKDIEGIAWQIAKIRKDTDLRDQYVGALAGLDARLIKEFKLNSSSVAFDKDGKRLLVGGWKDRWIDQRARLWNRDTGAETEVGLAGGGPVTFSADGTPLQLVARDTHTLVLWNGKEKGEVRRFEIPNEGKSEPLSPDSMPIMALSPNGARVAASIDMPHGKGRLVVWTIGMEKPLFMKTVHATAIAFSPDGEGSEQYLAAGDGEGRVHLWSLPDGKAALERPLRADRMSVLGLAFGSNPSRRPLADAQKTEGVPWLLAAGDTGSTVSIWDLSTGVLRHRCLGSRHSVHTVAFSPDGTLLASAGRGDIRIWDAANGRLLLNLENQRNWHTSVCFAPDGNTLAGSSAQVFDVPPGVDVWHLENGRGIQTLRGLDSPVAEVRYSPNSRLLSALGDNWKVGIWELQTTRLLHVLEVGVGYTTDNAALALSPDGKRFAYSTGTQAELWNLSSGKREKTWPLPPGLLDRMAFDATGKKVFSLRLEAKDRKSRPFDNDPSHFPRVWRLRNLTSDGLDELKTVEAAHKEYRSAATIDGKYFVISGTINKENQERIILAALDTGGQVLWERTYDTRRAAYAIDPLGRLLALTTQEDGSRPRQSQLLELPSLKLIRTMNYFPALGPDELGYWMTGEYKGGGTYSLFRGSQEQPVVNFGTDFLPQGAYASFSPDGSTIAAPTFDGTVTLILIETLREKMTSAGFGR